MPQALKFQEKYGDDVQVLFIESQNHGMDEVENMILNKQWFSDHAMWTTEAPFQTGRQTIPSTVLLGNDGEVLFNNSPIESKIEELVLEQLKLAKKGAKDLPPVCVKALADFDKGGFAAAINALDAVQDGPEKAPAKKLADSLRTRMDAKVAELAWLVASGEFDRADKLAPLLAKSVAGLDRQEAKVKELADKLVSQELVTEREAAKAFAKVWSKMQKDRLDSKSTPGIVKALTGVAEKFPKTLAAKRAEHLVQVVQFKPS